MTYIPDAAGPGATGTISGTRLAEVLQASRSLIESVTRRTDERAFLQQAIEAITAAVRARYGAIGVLDEQDQLKQFVHTGMPAEMAAKMPHPPTGKGLLGVVVANKTVLRIDDIEADPRSGGFPPHHPVMKTLLAAPVLSLGHYYGRLYFCDRTDGKPFDLTDELIASHFALVLSVALDKLHDFELLRHKDEARWRSEERYRLLVEMAPNPIFVLQDHKVAFANSIALKLIGAQSVEQLRTRDYADFLLPEYREAALQRFAGITAGSARIAPMELRLRALDGRILNAEIASAAITFNGAPAVLNVARDVTQERRDERELRALHHLSEVVSRSESLDDVFREALQTLRVCTDANRASILNFDHDGVMRFAAWDGLSDAYRRLTEGHSPWPADATEALPVLVADPQQDRSLAPFLPSLQAEGIRSLAFFPLMHQRQLLGKFVLYFDERHDFRDRDTRLALTIGEHLGIAVARHRAIEHIRSLNAELEERVQRRTMQLTEANHELEAFAYSVSHDLRAPLRALDGYSKILLEDCAGTLDEVGRHHLGRIVAATQRMGRLIDDLLRLSRVGRSEIRLQDVDLSDIAREIAHKLQERSPTRSVEFAIAEELRAEADHGLVRIALDNLLDNAWKYTGRVRGARIEFGMTDAPGVACYFVRDNGAGFDMKYARNLFAPFHRMHVPGDFEGMGIGLALVRRIVQRHGGRIWADARPNEGATFYFTLWESGIPAEVRAAGPAGET
jgi:PAS domain S-box-containing protein